MLTKEDKDRAKRHLYEQIKDTQEQAQQLRRENERLRASKDKKEEIIVALVIVGIIAIATAWHWQGGS